MKTNLQGQKANQCLLGAGDHEGWITKGHEETIRGDVYVHYLDYGDGFIVFTEVKIHCVRLSPQEADTTIGSDFKRAVGWETGEENR